MLKRVLVCEKCKGEWDVGGEGFPGMVTVSLGINWNSEYCSQRPEFYQTWCTPCVIRSGIFPPFTDEDKKTAPPELTMEEKLTALIESLGFTRAE